ncbi:MAG: cholesterol oxidase, partial [Arenicella sp.]
MDFDVLIIGSGAGGGVTALALCEQGFKVGLVERGPRFDPQKDYILNYPD